MAYTDAWATLENIAGTTPANQIDDKFRARFLGIKERMNEIFVDWTADPVVLKDVIKGAVTGKRMLLTAEHFRVTAVGSNATYTTVKATYAGDSGPAIAGIVLPVGATITLIEFLLDVHVSFAWEFYHTPFATAGAATPTIPAGGSGSVLGGGLQILSSAVLGITITNSLLYRLKLEAGGSYPQDAFDIYGARITYNTTDVTQTL